MTRRVTGRVIPATSPGDGRGYLPRKTPNQRAVRDVSSVPVATSEARNEPPGAPRSGAPPPGRPDRRRELRSHAGPRTPPERGSPHPGQGRPRRELDAGSELPPTPARRATRGDGDRRLGVPREETGMDLYAVR